MVKLQLAPASMPTIVDRSSLTFGVTGDEDSLARKGKGVLQCAVEDVNGDGLLDLVCHFNTQETGFQVGDTAGILRGLTVTGIVILGADSVRIKN